MEKNYKKIFDEILLKKFSKNMHAGYDPLEVDMFLDYVRTFIFEFNKTFLDYENKNNQLKKEIEVLKKKIYEKDNRIILLNSEIDSYKRDGYQSQKFVNDLSNLKEQVMELKKKKNEN